MHSIDNGMRQTRAVLHSHYGYQTPNKIESDLRNGGWPFEALLESWLSDTSYLAFVPRPRSPPQRSTKGRICDMNLCSPWTLA